MAAIHTVKIRGLKEVQAVLRAFPKRVGRRRVTNILMVSSRQLVADMKARAPVRTGALKDSIDAKPSFEGSVGDGPITVQVGVMGEFYGRFQEFGTAHHAAQPFIRPAWDANQSKIMEEIQARLLTALRQAAAGRVDEQADREHWSKLMAGLGGTIDKALKTM